MKNALGLIETIGLVAAIEAADAAVKAANVKLLGYELTRGGGMVVIKICGDVDAVKAAVDAGRVAAAKISKVYSTHVIPRPHGGLGGIIESKETVSHRVKKAKVVMVDEPEAVEVNLNLINKRAENINGEVAELPVVEIESDLAVDGQVVNVRRTSSCNLCNDPACSRKKGDPKTTCIHYNDHKEAK